MSPEEFSERADLGAPSHVASPGAGGAAAEQRSQGWPQGLGGHHACQQKGVEGASRKYPGVAFRIFKCGFTGACLNLGHGPPGSPGHDARRERGERANARDVGREAPDSARDAGGSEGPS